MRALGDNNRINEVIISTSLVALHLYSNGRLFEGKYHADAAASLTIASNLHQISLWDSQSTVSNKQLIDRQRIFWNTFELGCWTIVTGSCNSLLCEGDPKFTVITTWPSEVNLLSWREPLHFWWKYRLNRRAPSLQWSLVLLMPYWRTRPLCTRRNLVKSYGLNQWYYFSCQGNYLHCLMMVVLVMRSVDFETDIYDRNSKL
jgi:hypothetical protein